ncbi:TdeIII family type II restriction endonuclease [Sodalinema gerasimenkoae]|uniref:TdeIII family type II restriction endonuclease n=1 Tax=Sodalinema gerasimenkoae TaxID=2862348 RepID=UPI001359D0BF|nr:TdeIII family type II restriction endonuclease [Sodalinema gerasimenkoae]
MTRKNSEQMKAEIQALIREMMDSVLDNVLYKKPFSPDKHRAAKPLYAALVPDEIFKGSHFERKFVTPFGKVWEKLALIAAQHYLGQAEVDYAVNGTIKEGRLNRITEVLNRLEHPRKNKQRVHPNWDDEISYILNGRGKEIPITVRCDLLAQDVKTGKFYGFEIKAPLPNSDQTKVSKEKILKLCSMTPRIISEAYYALPYNPYGRKENYKWSPPKRWFNMKEDAVVLIGDEFWDKLGGEGTYQLFIEAVNELTQDYKPKIYRDYLGIEPPDSDEFFTLPGLS